MPTEAILHSAKRNLWQALAACGFVFALGAYLVWEAKNAGLPWDVAKGFDHSAPVAAIRPVAVVSSTSC